MEILIESNKTREWCRFAEIHKIFLQALLHDISQIMIEYVEHLHIKHKTSELFALNLRHIVQQMTI